MRMVVVLPAPLGPSRPNVSPCATSNETPSTATRLPFDLRRLLTWIAGTSLMVSSISPSPLYSGERGWGEGFCFVLRIPLTPGPSPPSTGAKGAYRTFTHVICFRALASWPGCPGPARGPGGSGPPGRGPRAPASTSPAPFPRSEEHTSELQSLRHLVC